jgi:hypothetical protein
MSLDKDNEIATTGIFVSLLCPVRFFIVIDLTWHIFNHGKSK